MKEQRCGTCKWFDARAGAWGWCQYEIPTLSFPIPIYCSIDLESGWRDLEETDGDNCPTYEVQP